MRILYHHRTRAGDAQGIHIHEIIRAFRSLGHEVKEAALVSSTPQRQSTDRKIGEAAWKRIARRIPGTYELLQLAYNLYGVPMLAWNALSWRPDFIYERFSLLNLSGVAIARLLGIPLVLEVNSPLALEQQRDGEILWPRFSEWTERSVCRLATRVIVVSTPLKEILIRSGIDERQFVVMPNGVDVEAFRTEPPNSKLRRDLGLEGKTVIGFVGWFRDWHRVDLLLEAFDRGGLAGHKAALLLIGDGPEMSMLKKYVAKHRLEPHVVFTGAVSHSTVPAYLNLIDVTVQPAANEYCCPMKILEYMALRKAIVAPRQMNIEEILENEREALFFKPGDADSLAQAMIRLVTQPQLRDELGRAAGDAIGGRGYLWTVNAQRVVDLVKPHLPANGRRSG